MPIKALVDCLGAGQTLEEFLDDFEGVSREQAETLKILVDQNLPRGLRKHLPEHEIITAREMKWEQMRNGALIIAAVEAGFEAIITIDKQLEYQQSLATLPLPWDSRQAVLCCGVLDFRIVDDGA